jgi:large repetitive protein
LMADADFNAGTRSQPLGDTKAGRSADLDALAAYVTSLKTFAPSPNRAVTGALTNDAVAGRNLFKANCVQCHTGSPATRSAAGDLVDVGTLTASSGKRLGNALTGLDVPTLRDAWATAPYLHDGSAPTIDTAIVRHVSGLSATEVSQLAEFVRQASSSRDMPNLAFCSAQSSICTLPAGVTSTVFYGARGRFTKRTGVTGSIACNDATFGDPYWGIVKSCSYAVDPPAVADASDAVLAVSCAADSGTCTVPAGSTAVVRFGTAGIYAERAGVTGSIACNAGVFGDPAWGIVKSCSYVLPR